MSKVAGVRLGGLLLASVVGYTLFNWSVGMWSDYWLRADAQQGVALITNKHWSGHGRVSYRYTVDQEEYVGVSSTDWRQKPSQKVGDKAPVYFSASHPWLSSLVKPSTFLEMSPHLFFIVLLVVLELLGLAMLFEPSRRWGPEFLPKEELTGDGNDNDIHQSDRESTRWSRWVLVVRRRFRRP